jgi:integrase
MARKQAHRRDGIYERKDRPGFWGSWTDASGRRRRREFDVPTLEDAKKALAAEKHKVEEAIKFGKPLLSEDSFAAFADEFLRYQERRIAPKVARGKLSQAEYDRQEGIVKQHLKPFFGPDVKLAAIRRKDVRAYINSRMGKVSDGSIIKEVNTLKRMFNIAVEDEKISVNPAHKAPVPKAPEGRVRYLTPEELGNVLRACPEWIRPIVGLLVCTGARRGEMLRARWADVDIRNRQIKLKHTKNGKERPAFLNDLALEVLSSMGAGHGKRGLLFPDVTPAQVTVAFIRACQDAGVEDFSLHDLRHHYSTMLRQNGVDLHTLQKLLGHSDPRMTDRYAHLSQPFLLDAAKRLDGVLTLAPAAAAEETEEADEGTCHPTL